MRTETAGERRRDGKPLSFSAGVELFGFVSDAKGFLGLQALCEIRVVIEKPREDENHPWSECGDFTELLGKTLQCYELEWVTNNELRKRNGSICDSITPCFTCFVYRLKKCRQPFLCFRIYGERDSLVLRGPLPRISLNDEVQRGGFHAGKPHRKGLESGGGKVINLTCSIVRLQRDPSVPRPTGTQRFHNQGQPYYDLIAQLMPSKAKGAHIFRAGAGASATPTLRKPSPAWDEDQMNWDFGGEDGDEGDPGGCFTCAPPKMKPHQGLDRNFSFFWCPLESAP
ncbi:hypothetical protein B0H14DRAFT_2610975 [Mycena olivaceomarginata]|nr:hypothetical protein B0H14DRAFT_2610975 [Mycena olivaceomarginata]